MPVTKVLPSEETFSDTFNDAWTKALQEDSQGSTGMPVSIQVIGYSFEDEKVLGIMKQLEKKIGYRNEIPRETAGQQLS